MRVLVTGVRGKVGRTAASTLAHRGHEVVGTDLTRPVYETREPGQVPYVQADLTDAGSAYAVVAGFDAVVHAAALPEPAQNVPHDVFRTNTMSTFNVVEACVQLGVTRLVNLSSEAVLGVVFAAQPFLPDYCPVDEAHPTLPQDAYALSKLVGEQICDAAVRRSALTAVSIRSSWVQWEGNYARNVGPFLLDPDLPSTTFWSYVDAYDLGQLIALAIESATPGHEVVYAAQPDNVGGRDLATAMARHFPTVRVLPLERPDAGGISIEKARRLFGWDPQRSWRDYLDPAGHAIAAYRLG